MKIEIMSMQQEIPFIELQTRYGNEARVYLKSSEAYPTEIARQTYRGFVQLNLLTQQANEFLKNIELCCECGMPYGIDDQLLHRGVSYFPHFIDPASDYQKYPNTCRHCNFVINAVQDTQRHFIFIPGKAYVYEGHARPYTRTRYWSAFEYEGQVFCETGNNYGLTINPASCKVLEKHLQLANKGYARVLVGDEKKQAIASYKKELKREAARKNLQEGNKS